jgi:hypothetical protein
VKSESRVSTQTKNFSHSRKLIAINFKPVVFAVRRYARLKFKIHELVSGKTPSLMVGNLFSTDIGDVRTTNGSLELGLRRELSLEETSIIR